MLRVLETFSVFVAGILTATNIWSTHVWGPIAAAVLLGGWIVYFHFHFYYD